MITLSKLLEKETEVCTKLEVLEQQRVSLEKEMAYVQAKRDVIAELICEAKSEQVSCDNVVYEDVTIANQN
jgi:hypothetical protein